MAGRRPEFDGTGGQLPGERTYFLPTDSAFDIIAGILNGARVLCNDIFTPFCAAWLI